MNYTVVIADDEDIVREGMADMLDGSAGFQMVAQARDGDQALALVRQWKPDLLITDVCMPRMDGIALVDQIRQDGLGLRIVIVSGYDDFAYAQAAVRMGATDYLLKPFLPEKLAEILVRLRASLDQEFRQERSLEELRALAETNRPLVRDRFLVNLLEGRVPADQVLRRAADLGAPLEARLYAAGVLRFDLGTPGTIEAPETEDPGVDLIRQYLVSALESSFGEPVAVRSCFLAENQLGLLFLCHDGDAGRLALRINQKGSRILENLERRFGVRADLGIGHPVTAPEGLPASLRGARDALALGFTRAEGQVLWFAEPDLKMVTDVKPAGADGTLVSLAKLADRDGVRAQLQALFAAWGSNPGVPAGVILAGGLETVLALWRAVEEYEDLREAESSTPPFADLLAATSFERFRAIVGDYAEKVVDAFTTLRAGRGANLVERVRHLVQTRYQEEHLTLDTMAASLYVSPNYLRQLFRRRSGQTLIQYLTQVRMEKAVELLADPSYLIQEVAEKTGFGHQRYFSMCFKKYHGKSPSEFRGTH